MKRALISDIHGNLEALRAVMADIRSQGVTEIYCLGDIVGYGPNPCECVDEVMKSCAVTIQGNHDLAVMFDPTGFNPVALRAIYWTRERLDSFGTPSVIQRRWDWLGGLPQSKKEGDWLYVHGSPRDPTNEYVFPEDIYNSRKMEALFTRVPKYCFQGHTHLPGIFLAGMEFVRPDECDYSFRLTGEKLMCNVGSVGQPRDEDPRACYVILTDEAITFRRVEYDVNITANRIYGIPDLDRMLGDRLRTGR
ncbi:MAG TPA: metallophosphoesterase family protein [Pirellulaceae bacterium]|nr:metallophosphoesterase family protein [Pirellulaceae bacterium]